MRNGVVLFTSDRGIKPADLARAVEERGFDTIYVPEHTHIPVKREAAHPGPAARSFPTTDTCAPSTPGRPSPGCAVTERIGLSTAVASRSSPTRSPSPRPWPP